MGGFDRWRSWLPTKTCKNLDQLLKNPGKLEKSMYNLPQKTRLKQAEGCCPPGSGNSLKRVSDSKIKMDFTGGQASTMVPPESSVPSWERGIHFTA